MVGMGKVMSQYLPLLDHDPTSTSTNNLEDTQKGLSRVRDALLDCADRDVDSMVKEWAWQEPTHSETTSTATVSAERERERTIHVPSSGPRDMGTTPSNPVSKSSDSDNARSHSRPPGNSMPNTPVPNSNLNPNPGSKSSFPSSTLSTPSKPALHLSRRTDSAPSTGLPRVPQTAPLGGSGSGMGMGMGMRNKSETTGRETPRIHDPLAGQSVDIKSNGLHGDRERLKRASAVNDPLGAGL